MDEKHFDNLFKDKLGNYSSAVPDGMWNKIEQKRKRRLLGNLNWRNSSLLMVGTWVLLAGTFTYALWPDTSLYGTHNVNDTTFTVEETTVTPYTPTVNHERFDKRRLPVKSGKIPATHPNDKTIDETALTTPAENQQAAVVKQLIPLRTGDRLPATDNRPTQQAIIANINDNTSHRPNTVAMFGSKKSTVRKNKKDASWANGEWQKPQSVLASGNLLNTVVQDAYTFNPGSRVPVNARSLMLLNSNRQLAVTKVNIDKCPSVNPEGRNDWYVEVYGSPDFTFKSVKGSTASAAYLKRKDSAESMRGGFTMGARITKNMGENLLLKAGLQFSQINERLNLRSENEVKTITVVTIRTITDNNGNTTTVTDTSRITQVGYGIQTAYNYYRSIELPVMVGYEWGNETLKTSVNAGLIASLSSWYEGSTFTPGNQLISVKGDNGNSGVYKTSLGMSLYGSIAFIKPVTERMDVFAEPYLRYNLSNLGTNNLGFSQKFGAVGLSLGIRYRFNNGGQHL